jgi:hypothetical protein
MTEFGKSFCRLFLLVAGVVIVFFQAMPALAVKVIDVSNTKHNLSTSHPVTATFYSTDESQICVFCHTPHNASPSVPLWNNLSTTMNFTVYSSATLEYSPSAMGAAGLPANSMSRLCLSCHEGTTGMNSLVNPGSTGANPTMLGFDRFAQLLVPKQAGAYISDELTRMHPVGIDYAVSAGDPDIYAAPTNAELKLFNGFLECSTCHDPHVDSTADPEYDNFLRIPNTSSAMCLACHDK